MVPTLNEMLSLAIAAEDGGDDLLARALITVAGRMERTLSGPSKFDAEEDHRYAHARGLRRCLDYKAKIAIVREDGHGVCS